MSYREFYEQVAPSVLELQKECSRMSKAEFNEFRKNVMCEVNRQNLIYNLWQPYLS
mgnify:CR=1 FL=1